MLATRSAACRTSGEEETPAASPTKLFGLAPAAPQSELPDLAPAAPQPVWRGTSRAERGLPNLRCCSVWPLLLRRWNCPVWRLLLLRRRCGEAWQTES
ncbi:MAG: hypothetical protein IJJ33_13250 [Victivallales bacterium]|nr:hypothetical protein [Victivallales bacterium]